MPFIGELVQTGQIVDDLQVIAVRDIVPVIIQADEAVGLPVDHDPVQHPGIDMLFCHMAEFRRPVSFRGDMVGGVETFLSGAQSCPGRGEVMKINFNLFIFGKRCGSVAAPAVFVNGTVPGFIQITEYVTAIRLGGSADQVQNFYDHLFEVIFLQYARKRLIGQSFPVDVLVQVSNHCFAFLFQLRLAGDVDAHADQETRAVGLLHDGFDRSDGARFGVIVQDFLGIKCLS